MVITALMMRRQRALVRAFEQVGATSVAQARSAQQMSLSQGMAWQQLVAHAVLRCPGEGRYFVDLPNWQRLQRRRRITALVVVAAVLLGLAVLFVVRPG
ncbi:MAG: hypothetical protein WC617_02620 [Rhodanobacter sp.]|jgi:hypothetical protein